MILASRSRADTWPARYLFPPMEELALRPLAGRAIDPTWLAIAGAVAALLAVPAELFGWRWTALVLLLLSGPLLATAARLATMRLAVVRRSGWIVAVRDVLAAATLLALGHDLAQTLGWGMNVLAGGAVAASIALAYERRSFTLMGGATSLLLASPDALIWTMLWFAAAGAWGTAVAVIAGYALASFFLVQRSVLRAAHVG